MKKLYVTSFIYAVLGLLAGVFFREFTKLNGFTDYTMLKPLHTHLLVLGFLFFLVLLILARLFRVHEVRSFTAWYYVYNAGMLMTIGTMTTRGILQVLGRDMNGLNHMAGLGHAIVGAAIIWLMVLLGKTLKEPVRQ
ncbi:DUF2871 domain-containing protein [Paenibacillus dendritiformis]|uniref:DUF2871 domain-containing protein n=1 Tax=Paenibacillus dendritiformis TaxID=130049 RepID=UPI00248D0CF2|nr:DUF2871 domain-containing protein [Paenibacillus dendritiformis]WGU92033.1 DUF2871 domain-containing protein [Paenibacillus dendritiformis]